jgi:hypothetical protein
MSARIVTIGVQVSKSPRVKESKTDRATKTPLRSEQSKLSQAQQ